MAQSLTEWQDLVRSVKPTAPPVSGPGYGMKWSTPQAQAATKPVVQQPVAAPETQNTPLVQGPSMRSWDGVSGVRDSEDSSGITPAFRGGIRRAASMGNPELLALHSSQGVTAQPVVPPPTSFQEEMRTLTSDTGTRGELAVEQATKQPGGMRVGATQSAAVAPPAPAAQAPNTFWQNHGMTGPADVQQPQVVAQQPTPITQAQAPDYSDVIAQLIDQASETSRIGGFDRALQAKQRREGAKVALNAIGGMRGQDIQAATSANQIAAQQQQGELNRQTELDRAALGLTGAQIREQGAAERALEGRLDTQAYRQAQMETENAKVLEAARQEELKRRATAAALLAQTEGAAVDQAGNVRVPSWFGMRSRVDKPLTAGYNAALSGVSVPQKILFPKTE